MSRKQWKWQRVAGLALKLGVGCLVLVAIIGARRQQDRLICQEVILHLNYHEGSAFVDEAYVWDALGLDSDSALLGVELQQLDLHAMESRLTECDFILDAEVSVDLKGALHIDIKQEKALLRLMHSSGVGYYLAESGRLLPCSDKFTPRVLIASGNLTGASSSGQLASESLLTELRYLAVLIQADPFLQALTTQLFVREDGMIELIPQFGPNSLLLGSVDWMTPKRLDKLQPFYKQGLAYSGFDAFTEADLRFAHQIICIKN